MSKICTKCGKENRDNMTFCAECGEKLPAATPKFDEFEVEPTMRATPTQMKAPEPPKADKPAPAPVKAAKPAPVQPVVEEKSPGMIKFLIYRIIFAIPVFGWIMAFILSFIGKEKVLKSYARATLVWTLVWIAVFVIIWIVINLAISKAVQAQGEMVSGMRETLMYFFDILSQKLAGNATITLG